MVSTSPDRILSPIDIGELAPDFELHDATGLAVSLKDFRGQSLVLVFYPDDWDPALSQQLAFLNEIFRKLPEGFEAFGVSRNGLIVDFDLGSKGSFQVPVLHDRSLNGEVGRKFGVSGQRAIYVIGADGHVKWRQVGLTGTPQSIDDLLESLTPRPVPSGVSEFSRREFLVTAAAVAFALTLLPKLGHAETRAPTTVQSDSKPIMLNVNGQDVRISIEPRVTLLDALRERAGLTGTKKGCDHGQCGACTVLIEGRRVNSCLLLAIMQQGKKITTIEGLSQGDNLHPVQEAFIQHDGFQCGYCTPGQIMSAVACIHEGHANSDEDLQTWMSGNICRCGAYVGIREAILEARNATLKGAKL